MGCWHPSCRRYEGLSTKITDDTAVGKMILPNDHVDVIRPPSKSKAGDEHVSDTLFRNVRVAGDWPADRGQGRQKGAEGTTATLELDPVQAESLALAKTQGEISLALRELRRLQPRWRRQERAKGCEGQGRIAQR